MDTQAIEWLLEKSDPSVRYRTLRDLLNLPPDAPEVCAAQAQIPDSEPVNKIFNKMHPDGYWLYQGRGDGVEYAGYYTTHFNLAFLAELGMTRDDPRVARAVERYLGFQQPDGDFYHHYSCLYGYNLRTLVMLGYRDDPRVQKIIDLMLATERPDGGYLCDAHEGKYKTKPTKSCIRGSLKVLLAFTVLPELWDSIRCQQLVHYFLKRNVCFRMQQPNEPINWEIISTLFPVTWRTSLVEALYALSVMGYGRHSALNVAWRLLANKRDRQGRYILDWTPNNSYFKPGERGEPSKWVTLYANLALKHRPTIVTAFSPTGIQSSD